jgi:hypothetical protein
VLLFSRERPRGRPSAAGGAPGVLEPRAPFRNGLILNSPRRGNLPDLGRWRARHLHGHRRIRKAAT